MFNAAKYGTAIAGVLALDGVGGERPMPLVRAGCMSQEARQKLAESNLPGPLLAGLYLYFGCWEEAHAVAQNIDTIAGSYWHAIVHRQEPDAANAAYWFGQVGRHPLFPELQVRASEIGFPVGQQWDPRAFLAYCENARPGSNEERLAMQVQLAEWQLLFDWCWQEQQ
jgi:hypothetical protein